MRLIFRIAWLEFVSVLTHPLILVVGILLIIISFLYGAGNVSNLQQAAGFSTNYGLDVLVLGFGSSWQSISMICTILAIFLGATMIPYERWNNSLNILLTKPLYTRDVVLGKFFGLSGFMLLFNTFALLLLSLLMILFFRGPISSTDFVLRLVAYVLVMTLACSLGIALNMLFGIISKNILFVATASITYVFFDWIWYSDRILGNGVLSLITPMNLYNKLINPIPNGPPNLFNTTIPLQQWLNSITPFLALLLIEMIALLLLEMYIFAKSDST